MVDVFAALADPVRRSLLDEVAAGPARVVDLAAGHLVEERPPYRVGQCGEDVHPQKVTLELPVVEHADVGSVVPAA